MARIAGVDIPSNKAGEISLTYIFGIGRSLAKEILGKAGVDPAKKVQDWTDVTSLLTSIRLKVSFAVKFR